MPVITTASSVAGPKESGGSLKDYIDVKLDDDMFGEKTFEKAECKILNRAIAETVNRSGIKDNEVGAIISGDLLNQIIASTFSARNYKTAYLGVYNACSTFTEALTIGATFVNGGHLNNVICATSSHFSSAERQYRYPLELGSTRPPLSQWTVTGAGACMVSKKGEGVKITSATLGRIIDYGVKDVNNMGAAMAPAAADTIVTHFNETGFSPSDYDLIVSGDLGTLGSRILKDLLWEKGFDVEKQHVDCGELIYNICEDEYQGGSGAGCSSVVFSSYLYSLMREKKIEKIMLVATGALLSSLSSQQGESIPGIAHAVVLES